MLARPRDPEEGPEAFLYNIKKRVSRRDEANRVGRGRERESDNQEQITRGGDIVRCMVILHGKIRELDQREVTNQARLLGTRNTRQRDAT